MRAVCEACERAQPVDWKPGDLCVHCGATARHEVRCGWCTTWTPAATYCRTCGAEVVAEELFGTARMLKDAGVDRFSIPSRLAAMDAEQLDNFTRIYQRQAVVVARHVEQLTFLQRHLRHQHWAPRLEDQLISELPWQQERLREHDVPLIELIDDNEVGEESAAVATARKIAETTPVEITRALAPIARLRLDDWSAFEAAGDAFRNDDPTIRDEAALALTSWRVRLSLEPFDGGQALIDTLRASSYTAAATVRLATLTDDAVELTAESAGSDPETTFAAALLVGDVDRLEAALHGDVLERSAAAGALIRLGQTSRIGEALANGPDSVRSWALQELARARRPFPELTGALVDIVESTTDPSIRELAVRVVCPTVGGGHALRIARCAAGDRRIVQSLLQRTELPPEAMADLFDWLIGEGLFAAKMFGVSSVVDNDRLADTFVPARWPTAAADVRTELLGLAELQLQHAASEDLHVFLLSVVFGSVPSDVRTEAWWVLHRWYRSQDDYRGEGPFRLDPASIDRFMTSMDAFLPRVTAVVGDVVALSESAFADFAANLFSSANDAFIAEVQSRSHVGAELVEALIAGVATNDRSNVNESMIVLLSRLATLPEWRADALRAIRATGRAGNHHVDAAIRRLEGA